MAHRQSGFTLLESLLALFVVLGTVAAIAYGMRATSKSATSINQGQDLLVLVENIRRTYEHVGHYGGLSNTTVLADGLAPNRLLVTVAGSPTVRTELGAVTIAAFSMVGTEPNHAFQLTFLTDREQCADMLSTLAPHAIGLASTNQSGAAIGYNLVTSPTMTGPDIQRVLKDTCMKNDEAAFFVQLSFS